MMKAIVLNSAGDASKLEFKEVDKPIISHDEVLIKVKAASINHLDIWVRKGQYPNIKYPVILGCEGSGEVVEIGKEVANVKVGEKVLIFPSIPCWQCEFCTTRQDNFCKNAKRIGIMQDGCYAEYVKAPASNVVSIGNLSYESAAAIPITYGTSYRSLITLAKVKPGETVLIIAAGSGVGTASIQIAKLAGATVIASAGSDEKLTKAKSIGADYTINYTTHDLETEARKITNGVGVDIVLEQVGGSLLVKSIKSLKRGGRIVVLGTTASNTAELDIQYFYRNTLTMYGTSGITRKELLAVFNLVKDGKLHPVIDKVFALKDAIKAHEYIEERKTFGKVILKP